MNEAQDLLRRLAANDEHSLQMALVPTPEFGRGDRRARSASRRGRAGARSPRSECWCVWRRCWPSVRPTASLRWAVELALATGATDDAVAAVLLCTAAETGGAQVVWSASRLALALGFDLDIDGWDGV